MTFKGHYKKLFVGAAALVLLFAPVGMATKSGTSIQNSAAISTGTNSSITQQLAANHILFPISLELNFALATDTTSVPVGAGAGTAVAQSPNLLSCASSPATCGVYYVSLVINGIMSLLLMGGAWLVELGLQFNDNVFNSPAIQTGFSVALAIANLGFVLGIIIIAIATILRNQTYGIKQLLWKLVIMAILVNFGLVITAPIVGFANSMSNYFINATTPSTATGGYSNYVLTLTGAFAPQTALGTPTSTTGVWQGICQSWLTNYIGPVNFALNKICHATNTSTTNPANNFWQNTMAMVFDIVFSVIAVFVFLCLAVLLIIRYLILGGLLIILPLAWLTYVFPKFDNSYSKWWNTFIKWTFFPPLALFFIYLAFTAAVTTNTANGNAAAKYSAAAVGGAANNADDSLQHGMATQTGLNEGIFAQAADEVLLAGLMIMGLLFASSLAGKAGSTAVNLGATASKAIGGYAGRKAGRGAARAYQGMGGDRLNAALQRNRIPGLAAIGRGAANLTEAGTKAQIDARSKALGLGTMDDDRLKAVTQGLRGKADQLAALQEWQKRGKLGAIEQIGGTDLKGWLRKNQGTFKNYGQVKLQKDIDNSLASDETIRRAAEAKATAGATATMVDEKGIAGPAGATVLASDMVTRANEVIKDTNKAKTDARAAATVIDDKGIVGPAGATVLASDMVTRANEIAEKTQSLVKRSGADTFVPHNGSVVKAGDLLKYAQAASKGADDAMNRGEDAASIPHNGVTRGAGDLAEEAKAASRKADEAVDKKGGEALVADEEDILKKGAGQMVKAGELMRAASEKFWEGRDKGDISKMNFGAIFGGKMKFGLDERTLQEIGRSVAHGIVTQTPSSMGTVAGKIDNWKQLTAFTETYRRSIEEASKAGRISDEQAKNLVSKIKQVLNAKLSFLGGGGPGPTPTAPTP